MNFETLATLGEPNRFRIVEFLRMGPQPVNSIVDRLGLRQSQVSQHLKVLRDAGFVAVVPRAQQRLYGLQPEPLKDLHDWLEGYRQIWQVRFEQLGDLVETLKRAETSNAAGEEK